jgi:hypothetical protein
MQLLRLRRKRHIRVEFALRKQFQRLGGRIVDHGQIRLRVQPDISRQCGDQRGCPAHADTLSLQVRDAANVSMREQLVAAGVHTGENGDWRARIDRTDVIERQARTEIELAPPEIFGQRRNRRVYVADVNKSLGAQQRLADILRGKANDRDLCQPDAGGLGLPIRRAGALKRSSEKSGGAGERKRRQKATARLQLGRCLPPPCCRSAHAFSSLLSSLNRRKSVPSAMIFCGFDLIMPISCKRSV